MTEQESQVAASGQPQQTMHDPEAANQAAMAATEGKEGVQQEMPQNKEDAGAPNDNSAISFWSSSNSDSDDFNDAAGKNSDAAGDPTSRK